MVRSRITLVVSIAFVLVMVTVLVLPALGMVEQYKVILNLLNGQQYFVRHVFQGNNNGVPTNQWPVYYGPSSASQYWAEGGISSDQPVLELVPSPSQQSSGAMFWREHYGGGNITITLIGTYSNGSSIPADGFVVYLFLKPTMWRVSPKYNYSIPYLIIYSAEASAPLEGEVLLPQSSTPYLVIQWDPEYEPGSFSVNSFSHSVTAQWNVWIVSNINNVSLSVGPYPSPTLGSLFAGWVMVGTGFVDPKPGDLINMTVTYDPVTNTLTGIVYDMNTTQLANFTLSLGSYWTPPRSGNYVFGIGSATGSSYANWALIYAAVAQTHR
jgi:hypothetical protein